MKAAYPHFHLGFGPGCLRRPIYEFHGIMLVTNASLSNIYGSLQIEDHTRSRFGLNEGEMSGSEAASFIQYNSLLDGTSALNLAGFATTYIGSEVEDPMFKKTITSPVLWNLGRLVSRR